MIVWRNPGGPEVVDDLFFIGEHREEWWLNGNVTAVQLIRPLLRCLGRVPQCATSGQSHAVERARRGERLELGGVEPHPTCQITHVAERTSAVAVFNDLLCLAFADRGNLGESEPDGIGAIPAVVVRIERNIAIVRLHSRLRGLDTRVCSCDVYPAGNTVEWFKPCLDTGQLDIGPKRLDTVPPGIRHQ